MMKQKMSEYIVNLVSGTTGVPVNEFDGFRKVFDEFAMMKSKELKILECLYYQGSMPLTLKGISARSGVSWMVVRKYIPHLIELNWVKRCSNKFIFNYYRLNEKGIFGRWKCVLEKDAPILFDGRQYSIRIPKRMVEALKIIPGKDIFHFDALIPPAFVDKAPTLRGILQRGKHYEKS